MFRTHLALGFLIGLLFLLIYNMPYPLLFLLIVTLSSGLPDIDHPKSKYGRKLFFLSIPISWISKHRGFFHSIFPALIIFAVLSYFDYSFVGLAILIGYIAHLIGDAITKQGINFLNPFSTFEIRGPLTTGALFETFIFYILIVINVFYLVKFIF